MKEVLFNIFSVLQFLFWGFATSTFIFWILTKLSQLPKDKTKQYLTSANTIAAYGGLLLSVEFLLNIMAMILDSNFTLSIYELWPSIILTSLPAGTSILSLSNKLRSRWFISVLLILVLNVCTMINPLLSLLVLLSRKPVASSWSYYGEFGITFWLGILIQAIVYFIIALIVMRMQEERVKT